MKRIPKGYDATRVTSRSLSDLLPSFLDKVQRKVGQDPQAVLQAWKEVVGEKLAPMTVATSFVEGVLIVKVSNSSFYSLLVHHEKDRLLKELQKRFPSVRIHKIVFRLG